jgi:hypothetical protein
MTFTVSPLSAPYTDPKTVRSTARKRAVAGAVNRSITLAALSDQARSVMERIGVRPVSSGSRTVVVYFPNTFIYF